MESRDLQRRKQDDKEDLDFVYFYLQRLHTWVGPTIPSGRGSLEALVASSMTRCLDDLFAAGS